MGARHEGVHPSEQGWDNSKLWEVTLKSSEIMVRGRKSKLSVEEVDLYTT